MKYIMIQEQTVEVKTARIEQSEGYKNPTFSLDYDSYVINIRRDLFGREFDAALIAAAILMEDYLFAGTKLHPWEARRLASALVNAGTKIMVHDSAPETIPF